MITCFFICICREEEKQDLSKSLIQELGYNHIDVDPVEASTYTAQTVDFPDSPHQLKLLQQKTYETQVIIGHFYFELVKSTI